MPVALTINVLLGKRLRNVGLLLLSLLFYAWGETWFVLVMMASILIDYCAALIMVSDSMNIFSAPARMRLEAGSKRSRKQKMALAISILGNLSILAFFKYFNFFMDNYNALLLEFGLNSTLLETAFLIPLPIGISFFTFQSMSYTIDVYRGQVQATRNLINFATFVSMFPQLVAGPIIRYRDVRESLAERSLSLGQSAYGVRRFMIGLSKKVLVANVVAVPADALFALPPDQMTTPLAWLAAICYTLQIYFDFSGYSDMAIGLGHILGFRFPENFNYPYISKSIREFWRRWHISLSSWFRDYLYIPLGGNRVSNLRSYGNLVTVFFLCGLWHGASWTFVIWGLYHGAFLVLERTRYNALLTALWRPLQHVVTLMVVIIGWVIFRADSLGQASTIIASMFALGHATEAPVIAAYLDARLLITMVIAVLASGPVLPALNPYLKALKHTRPGLRAWRYYGLFASADLLIIAMFFICVLDLSSGTYNPFIYFRF